MDVFQSVASILLCVCLTSTPFAADTWVVREDGVGPVKIGMTERQLSAALHQKLVEDDDSGSDNCFYVHTPAREYVRFMLIDSRLARIDVQKPGVFTASGLQVGDSEEHVRKIYGPRMKTSGHQYIDTGHYLTVRGRDRQYGVRFETDKGKIIEYYAGTYEAIQYVEGCL
jgi:hypothetical protein